MWLPATTSGRSSPGRERKVGRSCASPPLEGGEDLCDTYTDTRSIGSSGTEASSGSGEITSSVTNSEEDAITGTEAKLEEQGDLLLLFQQGTVPSHTFTHSFLQSILSSVESKDPVVASAWVETLLDVTDLLPKDILRRDILSLAVSKGQLPQPVASRILCCRLLGKICIKLDPYVVKKEALPLVQSLCQDVEHSVRACMCRHLDAVTRAIGLETTKNAILPELVEMANDEDGTVRLAAIDTVVNMLSLLDDESCKSIIIPLVKKFSRRSLHAVDGTLPAISKQMGRLCLGLAECFSEEERTWFLDLYRQLATTGLTRASVVEDATPCTSPMPDVVPTAEASEKTAQCRNACAYNFPAMVVFVGSDGFQKELLETFRSLCGDPHPLVRRTAASGLHEVIPLLGRACPVVLEPLIHLLEDTSCTAVLLPRLQAVLDGLAPYCTEQQLNELADALESCEKAALVSSCWRQHVEVLDGLGALSSCRSLHHRFSELLLDRLHSARALPCRLAASRSLLLFLRDAPTEIRRSEIMDHIVRGLGQGCSCRSRMLYVRLCGQVLDLFSRCFFKEHFFQPLLVLSGDPVANVRLKLCEMLPKMKSLLVLPQDEGCLQQLEAAVGRLLATEGDRDVSAALRHALEELDRIEVPTEQDAQPKQIVGSSATGSLTRLGKIPVREKREVCRPLKDGAVRPVSMMMRSNRVGAAEIKRLHRLSLDGSTGDAEAQRPLGDATAFGISKSSNRIPMRVTLRNPRPMSFHMPHGMKAPPLPPITSHLPACTKRPESPIPVRSTSRIPTPRLIRRRPQSECLEGTATHTPKS